MRSLLVNVLFSVGFAAAESGLSGWLRYAPLLDAAENVKSVPSIIIALNTTKASPVYVAGQELQTGIQKILGKTTKIVSKRCKATATITVGTIEAYTAAGGRPAEFDLGEDGFWLSTKGGSVEILGQNERGALYGAFEYLSMLAQGNFSEVAYATSPDAPVRWVNQWDNMDGSIERGYAGPSIFFENGTVKQDLTRVAEYARLLASVRINGIIVNNVNANATLLTPTNVAGLGRIADAMRPFGVRIGISLRFDSPQVVGGLNTFDPLDEGVISFWTNVTEKIYSSVPDFAGYLVKANSEGQPGPLTYNRTLAQGANLFANTLLQHGGIVMFRAFVYDNTINESDWKADRANAAVDFFRDLDGKFDSNVVVQIKYGPIDFQVREPVSPLFSHLRQTGSAIELQVTQEYLGQQCHVLYLAPLWKTILDFDMRVDGKQSFVKDVVGGNVFNQPLTGYAAVVNVGTNTSWLGSHLAMSNLYAYGRLAWDPSDDSISILHDWVRLTFGPDPAVIDVITKLSMESWPAYENYTGNLGIQTLTDITGNHFGPNPASQDDNGWGQWTRADALTIGMDRTVKNGTGFSGQYPSEVAAMYEEIQTTPDDLLLWFHHVNYTQVLKSGKSVIQHFYDAHYAGAETAQTFVKLWEDLEGKIDEERFEETMFRLKFQAGHSIVWRDAINEFYYNKSSIADAAGRVGHHPWRVEAENMELDGYKVVAVNPFETASEYHAVITTRNDTQGTATTTLEFPSGKYDLAVNYFDLAGGRAHWEVFLNEVSVGEWRGTNEDRLGHATSPRLDGHSATRVTFPGAEITKGDVLSIMGTPDGIEAAPLDYIAVLPAGVVD